MIIPISGFPDEQFNISINNKLYTFRFQYNERFDFWVFSLSLNEVVIFEGLKMVQGVNLGELYLLDIGGVFQVRSISGDLSDPTRNDLGTDKRLFYVTAV
jgi:hypothetical protein